MYVKKKAAYYTETFVTTYQTKQDQNPEHQTVSYLWGISHVLSSFQTSRLERPSFSRLLVHAICPTSFFTFRRNNTVDYPTN
jgi:hypothetical protein